MKNNDFLYDAFISYYHNESKHIAKKIENSIIKYRKINDISTINIPKINIYRDIEREKAGSDLKKSIKIALKKSKYLIYIASPNTAKRVWVIEELNYWFNILKRNSSSLIIIVTDGKYEFKTDLNEETGGLIIEETNIFPSAIINQIKYQPIIIDFRKLKSNDYDLLNEEFEREIARIVCTLIECDNLSEIRNTYLKLQKKEFKKKRKINILLGFTTLLMFIALILAVFYANNANKKENEANIALKKMQIAQDNEALQRFNDLEKRVIVIKNANADPTILIKQMENIANKHKDSIDLKERINKIK